MTEGRAVALGFAAVSLVMIGVTALFGWSVVGSLAGPSPDAAEARGINRVFDAKAYTFDPIHGMSAELPSRMPWSIASAKLAESAFVCRASGSREVCFREARLGPCNFDRRIEIDLDQGHRIASVAASETLNCL